MVEGHTNLSSTSEGSSKADPRPSCRGVLVTKSEPCGRVQLRRATRGKGSWDFAPHFPISMHNTAVSLLVANTRATGNKGSKEKKKGRGGDRGGVGAEIKGHPEPHTKHFAFDLVLDHEGPSHFCTVRGRIMACFLNKKEYNTRNWQKLALTHRPEQGSHLQSVCPV